jgi:short-subunit dehydrogenase involved in D-alanine esterification of teichoic acids
MKNCLRLIQALLLVLVGRREQSDAKRRWNALTPEQKQAVVICHRAAEQIQQMRREAQAMMAKLEDIARRLDPPQRSREVAETLARRFNELYAAIEAIGKEHAQEEEFFRYADRYGEELGLWGPLP